MRGAGVILLALGACYSPSYRDCALECTPDVGCPGKMQCVSGRCTAGATCTDGGVVMPDSDTSCWPGVQPPTNFRPCTFGPLPEGFPPVVAALDIMTATTFDTDTGLLNGSPGPGGIYDSDGQGNTVWLAHVSSMTVSATLRVLGTRPLLVVADGAITINAVINVGDINKMLAGQCENLMGGSATLSAGGGGGGGNGGAGGAGGNDSTGMGSGSIGGQPHYTMQLSPLFPGCPGGRGGVLGTSMFGGVGGNGGGAIELVSAMSVMMSGPGKITAGGGGGSQGVGTPNGGPAGQSAAGGGGGGGAGGAILLEAPMISGMATAQLCAAGGGGGQGGSPAVSSTMGGGQVGDCIPGAGGFDISSSGGAGGGGSVDDTKVGTAGSAGVIQATYPTGGGGGGGGAGRIRLHGDSTGFLGMTAPKPTN